MSKKIELEYELKTRSGSAVWALISTPIGLMKWSDSDSYWEMKMFHSEIAGNYHLLVTDFADDDDVEGLEQLWNQNVDRLHRITGI